MKTTLIITTYNWTPALDAVLKSVANQTHLPDEVIVADDGSMFDTQKLIERWLPVLGCSLIHVWQTDKSFRAARARNLAIAKSSGDHLIFVDGDCLLPPHFVKSHRLMIRPRTLISGGRILLGERQTKTLLDDPDGQFPKIFSKIKHLNLWWLPFRDRFLLSWRAVRTCNMAIFKEDLLSVYGFDESYVGWGKEDSDLAVRMEISGFKIVSGRLGACVSHLFHGQQPRTAVEANEAALLESIRRSSWKPKKSCLRSIYCEG